jgi:hypothetical protein
VSCMDEGPQFPRAEVPRWNAPGVHLWLAFVGIVLSAVPLVFPEVGRWPEWVRWSLALGPMVPLVLWTVVRLSQSAHAAVNRALHYMPLYDAYDQSRRVISREREEVVRVATERDQARDQLYRFQETTAWLFRLSKLLHRYDVINVILEGDTTLLLLRRKTPRRLSENAKFVVVNSLSGEWLGTFEMHRTTRQGYLVREVQIGNSLWWGYMHTDAAAQRRPLTNATAILLPDSDDQEEASA